MVRRKHFLFEHQSTLQERLGLSILTLFRVEQGRVIEGNSGVGMARPKHFLSDCQSTLQERLGSCMLVLLPIQPPYVTEYGTDSRMVRRKHFLCFDRADLPSLEESHHSKPNATIPVRAELPNAAITGTHRSDIIKHS